jgi:hypothetical protein
MLKLAVESDQPDGASIGALISTRGRVLRPVVAFPPASL